MPTTRRTATLPAEALSTLDSTAQAALTRLPVIPDRHEPTFWATWQSLYNTAVSLGILTVGRIVTDQARLIEATTGLKAPTKFTPTCDRDIYHLHRNTLLTVLLAAYLAQPAAKPVAPTALVPALKCQRTSQVSRPAADDEIALARTWALLRSRTVQGTVAAATYGLCDAGMRLDETKRSRLDDFDDLNSPEVVLASGRERLAPRFVVLDEVQQQILVSRLRHVTRQGGEALLYNPRGDEASAGGAHASAINTMNRFYRDLGLDHSDLQPGAVSNWRVEYTWSTLGMDAAKEVAGMSQQQVEGVLGLTRQLRPRPAPAARGTVKAM